MTRVDLEQWRAREVARLLSLVEAERRYYQEIVAGVPVGLAVLASDLTLLSANRAFQKMFGLTSDGLGRVRLEDLFPGEQVRQQVLQVLDTAIPQTALSVEFRSREGARPLRLSIQPFRGWNEEAGSEVLLLVEENVELETPLQLQLEKEEPEPQLRHASELLENLDAIVWERDADSLQFSYVGGRAEEILGYPAEQWLATPDFDATRIRPEDRKWVEAFYRSTISSGASRSCEYRAVTADGRTVWLRDIVRVQCDEEGQARKLSGVTVDISTQKQQGERLAQSEKMAALGRLARKVTHDCNNLLMILSGYGEELLSNLPVGHPSRKDAEEILAAAERLSKITNELLAFTRRPMLLPKVFDLNSLLQDIEEKLRHELGEGIQLELNLDAGLGQVNADSEAIANSILRLAEQARNAMPDGGRFTISTASTELSEASPHAGGSIPPGRYVTLTASDTGPRLDEETRIRLFEPFFSSRRAGRGLPSVYSVMKNSGGDVVVASGPQAGAVFTIYLPRVEEPARTATPAVAAPQPAPPIPAAKPVETVLVVEDESGIRALMRKILQKQGYHVLEASRGEEALRISEGRKEPIHLLLTDVVMPQMSGRELADRLKVARPEMKVLFVSGYADEDLVQHGPLPPGSAFLQKPFSLATLLEKARNVLNGSPGNR